MIINRMHAAAHHLLQGFEHQSSNLRWSLLLIATALIGAIDYLTGYEASVSVLYLIHVLLAAWSLGLWAGLFFAFTDSATLILTNWFAGLTYSAPWLILWNIAIRGMVYAMVAYLAVLLHRQLAEAQHLSLTDPLTGAWNRRAFYQALAREMARAERGQHPFSLVYIDVDDFKAINDRLGHKGGDKILATVISVCNGALRQSDIVARLGGDEFALLLPDTDEETLRSILPRLRDAMKAGTQSRMPVTFSIGAVTFLQAPDSIEAVVHQADSLMYQVKQTGKDNILYALGSTRAVQE